MFLFDKTLIIAPMGTPTRKRDVLLLAVGCHFYVDKRSSIVGINPEQREREQRSGALESCYNRLLTAM
jgi:hypothetical protein